MNAPKQPPTAPSATWLAIYDELRQIASRFLLSEQANHTLQPTALVHEAFLRLQRARNIDFSNRRELMAAAAVTMRRILIDYARSASGKRKRQTIGLVDAMSDRSEGIPLSPEILLTLDNALDQLAEISPRQASIVEMRFFGGFGLDDIAETLEVSERTVKRDWAFARAWLLEAMEGNKQGT